MRPYQIVAEQEQAEIGHWPSERRKVPGWLLDKIAEEKFSGGYTSKANPICPTCRIRKSVAGECFC